ncbi:MAG: tRNA (guanosine(46)-N7)-methyltransferase TrmB [Lachnospiraceae bacterium]|nr:tRNA (guanosine(46)-N7)-methyltransferase TrmB [Lachnospiraceae bacterium]
MRLRNVKGAGQRILENPYTIQTDEAEGSDYRGLWNQNFFHNDHPIHIEIGMGKGRFIIQMAQEHPDINYIGVEKYSSVLVRALDKRETLETGNLLFLRMDAADIAEFFAPGEVSQIYLNFSDPWPKDRHAKRRLTSIEHLRLYEQILQKDGRLQFKTDNRPLFDFSLEQLDSADWATEEANFDLHRDGPAPHNVMTEYEEKFYHLGIPICRLLARRPPI